MTMFYFFLNMLSSILNNIETTQKKQISKYILSSVFPESFIYANGKIYNKDNNENDFIYKNKFDIKKYPFETRQLYYNIMLSKDITPEELDNKETYDKVFKEYETDYDINYIDEKYITLSKIPFNDNGKYNNVFNKLVSFDYNFIEANERIKTLQRRINNIWYKTEEDKHNIITDIAKLKDYVNNYKFDYIIYYKHLNKINIELFNDKGYLSSETLAKIEKILNRLKFKISKNDNKK